MPEITCPKCHKTVSAAESAAFCPFCGERLQAAGGVDLSAVRAERNPVKKHAMLEALKQTHPDNLEVAEEILYLGRLYDRGKRGVDFSIIKSYMLNVYLEPETLKKNQREVLRREIFTHPDLDICLNLCDDQEVFLRRYLEHIAEEFIRLFLKGSAQYMHSFFGYTNESKAPKHLALPVAGMLKAMRDDETLTGAQRELLMRATYTAFARQMNGQTTYLDEALQKYRISMDSE